MRGQLVQAMAVLVLVLYSSSTVEARKTAHNLKHAPKNNDAAHASRKYTRHTDPLSGRSGAAHQPHAAPVGRKLRQALAPTDIMPGMSMCPSAADAANFIVGAHATQLAVSNAAWTAGACDMTTCARDPVSNLVSCSTGLQWGIVQTWPADHALAAVFGNSGGWCAAAGSMGMSLTGCCQRAQRLLEQRGTCAQPSLLIALCSWWGWMGCRVKAPPSK